MRKIVLYFVDFSSRKFQIVLFAQISELFLFLIKRLDFEVRKQKYKFHYVALCTATRYHDGTAAVLPHGL